MKPLTFHSRMMYYLYHPFAYDAMKANAYAGVKRAEERMPQLKEWAAEMYGIGS